ncbi:MAG: excinuclease ABC subunit UvrC [Chloroflexi bacterium]|nr:MAG: excinuclease ABC subunit C [Actinobacteria bacterium 13_1_20CM_2_66_18]TMF71318.1 MAG: excinuclease ABC subunit UvrC [Chloroflexota bacterium]TMF82661.1 MAG: excinuclease ABC subunit UvrC [Chloroflexota bacterium]TMG11444.1 MAG: excinuclease ABC subunit UvrC [Chloroflexota bacterium]TMG59623.1 MAG: excinuclease ABC subunit UvrC [Chloroflexota bacterium]
MAVTLEDTIKRRLQAVPDSPGVYMFRDSKSQVIYVGKALRLRDRLRSYFTPGYAETARVSELIRRATDFEFVTTANEVEALVLENNLIKNYRPRFNIRLKDDKNYLYLKLPVTEAFPRVHYSRRVQNDGALYFGPYTSALSLRSTVKSIRQLLPFRTCSDEIFKQGKVCLDFHIKRCPGPCERRISSDDYKARINEVALFMEGRSDLLVRELEDRMGSAADRLDFENAARYRDQLQSIERIADRQKVLTRGRDDQDIVAYARSGNDVYVEVAYIRQGKMVGHDGHALDGAGDATEPELLRGFMLQYYSSATHVPRSVILPGPVEEPELIKGWLSEKRGRPVEVDVPQRGRLRALVTQLGETAKQELEQIRIQADYDRSRTEPMLAALAEALDLESPPKRIECYDISNIQGDSAVGSMVVFEDGRPRNDHYRHFRIKFAAGPNDFAMLQEVLRRRLERLESAQRREEVESIGDRSFTSRPDLILIDGGKGQLSAALEVTEAAGYADIPTFALAKEREEIFAPGRAEPIVQERNSPGMFLVQRIRDEAHRFAITHHRKVRARKALTSPLDSVEGIGPARKRALLRHFGSVQAIREAPVGEIVKLGIPERLAARLKETL